MDKKEIGYCKDCKWFINIIEDSNFGECYRGIVEFGGEGEANVYANFGCIHWEAKDD